MRIVRTAPLLVALLATACVTYPRGTLSAAAPKPLPLETHTVGESVEGRACGEPLVQRVELAVDDALAQSPGANALVDTSFYFERLCMVVRGTAVTVP